MIPVKVEIQVAPGYFPVEQDTAGMRRILQVLIPAVDAKDLLVLIADGAEKTLLVSGFAAAAEFVVGEAGIVTPFQVSEFDLVQFLDAEEVSAFAEGILPVDQGHAVVLGSSLVGTVVSVDQKEETKSWWVAVVTARGAGLAVEWVALETDSLSLKEKVVSVVDKTREVAGLYLVER